MRVQLAIASIATTALISGCSADTTSTESVVPAQSSAGRTPDPLTVRTIVQMR
jgi:PBP1b-binding outer membrane lipoprotein LpoB